jgi:hypothetical protein
VARKKVPQCEFCPNRKYSEAHAWPVRYSKKLIGGKPGPTDPARFQSHHSVGGVTLPPRLVHYLDATTDRVCEDCNNGWMRRLEQRAIPAMEPMWHRGEEVTLTEEARSLCASWAMMWTLVFELCGGQSLPLFYQRAERWAFRESLVPPPPVRIWMAAYVGGQPGLAIARPLYIRLDQAPGTVIAAHATTFSMGQVAFQVVSHRGTKEATGTDHLRLRMGVGGPWEPTELNVWPPTSGDTVWPPEEVFDDPGLAEWSNRWASLPRITEWPAGTIGIAPPPAT